MQSLLAALFLLIFYLFTWIFLNQDRWVPSSLSKMVGQHLAQAGAQ
jgi:hypothetical protein